MYEKAAMQAGDKDYLKWIDKYEKHPTKRMEMTLAKKLQDPKRQDLYELICEKVCNASDPYPARNYGERIDQKIQRYREQVDKKLKEQGFTGTYPQYESEHLSVCVTEKTSFTILESEDFKFKIQLMISECREKHPRKNAGFFKGYQRKGKIKKTRFLIMKIESFLSLIYLFFSRFFVFILRCSFWFCDVNNQSIFWCNKRDLAVSS